MTEEEPKSSFFMVFNYTDKTPCKKVHNDFKSARLEAKRLAKLNPGKQFVITKSIIGYEIPKIEFKKTKYNYQNETIERIIEND